MQRHHKQTQAVGSGGPPNATLLPWTKPVDLAAPAPLLAKYVALGTGEQWGWEGGGRAETRALHLLLLAQTGLQLCDLIVR